MPRVVAEGLESIVLSLLMSSLQAGVSSTSRRAEAARAVLDAALRPPPVTGSALPARRRRA